MLFLLYAPWFSQLCVSCSLLGEWAQLFGTVPCASPPFESENKTPLLAFSLHRCDDFSQQCSFLSINHVAVKILTPQSFCTSLFPQDKFLEVVLLSQRVWSFKVVDRNFQADGIRSESLFGFFRCSFWTGIFRITWETWKVKTAGFHAGLLRENLDWPVGHLQFSSVP